MDRWLRRRQVELRVALARFLLRFQLLGAVIPIDDFLGQPLFHRRLGLSDEFELALEDLLQVLRNHVIDRVALGLLLQVAANPGAFGGEPGSLRRRARRQPGAVVEVGSVVDVPGVA